MYERYTLVGLLKLFFSPTCLGRDEITTKNNYPKKAPNSTEGIHTPFFNIEFHGVFFSCDVSLSQYQCVFLKLLEVDCVFACRVCCVCVSVCLCGWVFLNIVLEVGKKGENSFFCKPTCPQQKNSNTTQEIYGETESLCMRLTLPPSCYQHILMFHYAYKALPFSYFGTVVFSSFVLC